MKLSLNCYKRSFKSCFIPKINIVKYRVPTKNGKYVHTSTSLKYIGEYKTLYGLRFHGLLINIFLDITI